MEGLTDSAFRATDEACFDTLGDCQVCYSLSGVAAAGTFTVDMSGGDTDTDSAGACSESVGVLQTTLTYELTALDFDGSWTRTAVGDFTIEATGTRSSEVTLESAQLDDPLSFDAELELTSLEVTVEDYYATAMAVEYTYNGFADHDWEISASVSSDAVTVTVTLDGSETCTGTGTVDDEDNFDLDIDCDLSD